MKTIYIISWYGEKEVGGVESVTHYMVEAWKNEYDVKVISTEMVKKEIYGFLLGKHDVLDAILVSYYANKVIKQSKKMKGVKNVLVVTQGYNAPCIKADIAFAHGTMRGLKLAVYQDTKWHLTQRFERRAWKYAKKVVAVGNHAKKEVVELYKIEKKKVKVIENCVNTKMFYPLEREKPKQIYTVLFCGRLEKRKGLDMLYRFAVAIEQEPDMRLLIAATDTMNINLFEGMNHTKVQVRIKREKMNEFFNTGNVMFFPSLYEGFEMVTLECLSAGIPVMGNAVGAVRELLYKGQKGVAVIPERSDMSEIILSIKELADSFNELTDRMNLHNSIVHTYDFVLYYDKLKRLVKG